MEWYRMLFTPAYGEKLSEVQLPESENIDLDNPQLWRSIHTPITVHNIHTAIKKTVYYDDIMKVKFSDYEMKREGGRIPVRVYVYGQQEIRPIVVFYHGGAFMMNNFDVYEYVVRYIARYSGAAVVNVEYRLAPEFKCPVGREDAYATLLWAREHARQFGGNPDHICVCGDSAGGNFAAAVSLMARDRKGPTIRKQIMVYPLVVFKPPRRDQSELRYGTGYFLEYNSQEEPLTAYFGSNEEEAIRDPYNSPLLCENLRNLPEAYILAAECDPLYDQGQMYAARLKDAGIKVTYRDYKGMIHSFLNYAYKETFECLDVICKAVSTTS